LMQLATGRFTQKKKNCSVRPERNLPPL